MELTKLVSEAYTISDTLPEGSQKWLVDFAGWCLEEAMCQEEAVGEQTATDPQQVLDRQIAAWLANRGTPAEDPGESVAPKTCANCGADGEAHLLKSPDALRLYSEGKLTDVVDLWKCAVCNSIVMMARNRNV